MERVGSAPRGRTLFFIACLLLPFADLYGQFDLVMKSKDIATRAALQKSAKKLRIQGPGREVRSRPERGAPILGTLKADTTVSILETRDGWGRIADGQWVKLSKARTEKEAAVPAAPAAPAVSGIPAKGGDTKRKRALIKKLETGANVPAKTHRCLGATVEAGARSLRLAVRGEWTEYVKRHERFAVLGCVRYENEPFVVVRVTGEDPGQAGIEAYSLDTLDKRFGYFCETGGCRETALPFPDDFPLGEKRP